MKFSDFKTEFKDFRYIMCKGIGRISLADDIQENGHHQVDYLITDTLTNTDWFIDRRDWKCRQVSVSLDVKKAKGMIELLQKYVEYKEGKA